jgi:hypothetical protein
MQYISILSDIVHGDDELNTLAQNVVKLFDNAASKNFQKTYEAIDEFDNLEKIYNTAQENPIARGSLKMLLLSLLQKLESLSKDVITKLEELGKD